MVAWLRAQWAKVTFYYSWPSWLTEVVAGIALAVIAWGVTLSLSLVAGAWVKGWPVVLVLASAMSYLYESYVDPNGFHLTDLTDVVQREGGIILALVVAELV